MSVIINPIKRLSPRFFSHVREEISEVFKPSSANFDAASAISFIGCHAWSGTTANHSAPYIIGRGGRSVSGMTMFGPLLPICFAIQPLPGKTTARLGPALSQCVASNNARAAAITDAGPHSERYSIREFILSSTNYEQPPKSLSDYVVCFDHELKIIMAGIFGLIVLAACATSPQPMPQIIRLPPIETVRNVYPDLPSDMTVCLEEPRVPDGIKTDTELAQWTEAVRMAGADCRAKLGSLRALVATWPRP